MNHSRFAPVILSFIYAIWLIAANQVHALEFQCELPGDVRYIRVDIPGKEKLCEVSVKYEYNGENKVLWHAQNDTSFCTARAYELRDKYINSWDYKCTNWPDRDGIDKLSPSQRTILDQQLKSLIERGRSGDTPYRVTAVKALASSTQENTQSLLAFQYFMDNKTDYTEVIVDDGDSWKLMASIDNLAAQIESDAPLGSALIHAINDTGSLEIHTTVKDGPQHECIGSQVLRVTPDGDVTAKTSHIYVCHEALAERQDK